MRLPNSPLCTYQLRIRTLSDIPLCQLSLVDVVLDGPELGGGYTCDKIDVLHFTYSTYAQSVHRSSLVIVVPCDLQIVAA